MLVEKSQELIAHTTKNEDIKLILLSLQQVKLKL